MPLATRLDLRFGPYTTPRYQIGDVVIDDVRGEVTIVGTSAGRIPWPIGQIGSWRSLVVYEGLAVAVRQEANQAVCHHWGVAPQTVSKWRKVLGIVGQQTPGTTAVRSETFLGDAGRAARKALLPVLSKPDRAAKIAAAKRGVPRSPETIEKMRQANLGKRHSDEARAKMRASHARRRSAT